MESALLYRMPLDGGEPAVVGVSGSLVDQFSFLEEGGHLNVELRAGAQGDGMWRAEVTEGDVVFLRLPLSALSMRVDDASSELYRPLPGPVGEALQDKFIGGYALYGSGSGWGMPSDTQREEHRLFAYSYASGDEPRVLDLSHPVERIEALGVNAIVVGSGSNDLHFSTVALGRTPAVVETFTRQEASQGEARSHGFFYKAEDMDSGILGLPVRRPSREGYEPPFEDSASLVFLRNASLHLTDLGELTPQPQKPADDACRASCVDWYGDARPIFLGSRILALLGYELVEGRVSEDRIEEVQRVEFAPRPLPAR